MNQNILLVDDDETFCELVGDILKFEGYGFTSAYDGNTALQLLKTNQFDLLLLDLDLPDIDGIKVLKQTLSLGLKIPIVMVSGKGNIKVAVEAVKSGAYDFIEKPIDAHRLLLTVKNTLEANLLKRIEKQKAEDNLKNYGMIGVSNIMNKIFALIDQLAPTNSPIFITGESGTGKELVARSIHHKSKRADAAFISVNCSAIPETLIESELFGYEKGAFTDARHSKKGLFQTAHQGTIFLDEVGDLSLNAQAKILRVLESGEILPVGSETSKKVDVRLISATNKNIEEMVATGLYREDLFYRINVIPVYLPPLREKKDDIDPLSKYFLEQSCQTNNLKSKKLLPQALLVLKNMNWKGNVRELKNIIEKLAILSPSQKITSHVVHSLLKFPYLDINTSQKETLKQAREAFEKAFIETVLHEQNWNMTKAAEILDIERSHLYRKVEQLGIK